jgi:hypothetical protein
MRMVPFSSTIRDITRFNRPVPAIKVGANQTIAHKAKAATSATRRRRRDRGAVLGSSI